jgi:hypothetical protein
LDLVLNLAIEDLQRSQLLPPRHPSKIDDEILSLP